jgi:hypothetical protein
VAAKASFQRDGSFVFDLSLDVSGSPDPKMDELISPEEAALTYLKDGVEFRFDGAEFEPAFGPLEVVERKDPLSAGDDLIQLQSEASGKIPSGAKSFQVRLSPETDVALVMVVVKDGVTQRRAQTIFAGEVSRPVDLGFVGQSANAWDLFQAEVLAEQKPPTVLDAMKAGAAQILAPGGRRALLVVTLLFLAMSWRGTLLQIVCFSVGALAGEAILSGSDWMVSPRWREVLLVAALFGLAAHNVSRFRAGGSRFLVAFLAGGLGGLASTIAGGAKTAAGLLAHAGGLIVVALAGAFVLWISIGHFRKQPWYQERLVVPWSFWVIGVGVLWLAMAILRPM